MAKDDLNKRKEQLQAEYNLNEKLLQQAKTQKALSNEAISLKDALLKKLNDETDVGNQITSINEAIEGMLKEQVERGDEINQHYIDQLDRLKDILQKEKERKELTEEIKDTGKDFASDLGQSLGLSKELSDALMTASIAAIGLVILKKVGDYIASAVTRMRELNKEMGASVGNTLKLQGNILAAQSQLNPLLYSTEEVSASMQAIVKSTGDFNKATPTAIANVTEMTSLLEGGVDAAVSLNRTLTNTGVDAGKLTDNIKEMANKMGQDAGPAMDYLAANQLELNGMSEEQILLKAKEALEMKKMGVDMQKMVDLASEQLDIESSLKDEMKLRTMLGKEISFNELRAAQASGDAFAVAKAQKNLIDQLGGSLEGNLQVQRMISEATGLTKEEMLNVRNATMEQATAAAEGGDALGETANNMEMLKGISITALKYIGMITGALLALWGVSKLFTMLNKLNGGKNPVSKLISDFGTTEVLKGAAAMLLVAASLAVLGLGLQQFMGLSWEALAMAGVAMIGLLGALTLLGMLMASPLGGALLTGAAVMLIVASSLLVLGYAIQAIATGFEMLGNITEQISTLATLTPQFLMIGLGLSGLSTMLGVASIGLMMAAPGFLMFGLAMIPFSAGMLILSTGLSKLGENIGSLESLANITPMLSQLVGLVPGLIALSGAFYLLSGSLISLSLGLSTIGLLLPVLSALGTLLPTVSAAFGGDGGESAKESSDGGGVSMKEVVEEIKGLRSDIQAQPIMINVDGRVVSEITKVQSRKLSTRKSGYGG